MALSSAVLDAMLAAGCSAEQIVAAVKADQAEQEARKDSKRAGNAERQQRFRDNRKDRKEAVRNTRNARNALRSVTPPIDNTHTPQTNISSDEESQSETRDDVSAVIETWNATAEAAGLATCRKLTGARGKACRARLRAEGLEAIQAAIQHIPKSAFLRGETGEWAGASIDFLLRPDTVTKILEGKYDDRIRNHAGSSNVRPFAKPVDGAVTACDDFLGQREPAQPVGRYSPSASAGHRGLTLAASRTSR